MKRFRLKTNDTGKNRANNRGKISLWNPASERIFGYSEAEARGAEFKIYWPALK
ncbi:MAG: PAS domain S-box protein [Candidatus Aminicenantes bacterium]|nr:PAS domain S-box protein [Candidatus Aminicenantes bacterium]